MTEQQSNSPHPITVSPPHPVTPSPRHPTTPSPCRTSPEVYARHLEEFQFLWGQRQAAPSAPRTIPRATWLGWTLGSQRIGRAALGRRGGDSGVRGASGRGGSQAAWLPRTASSPCESRRRPSGWRRHFSRPTRRSSMRWRQALCHGPIDLIEKPARAGGSFRACATAVAALEALAFHRRPDPGVDRLVEFLQDESPQVRRAAWRVMAISNSPGARG